MNQINIEEVLSFIDPTDYNDWLHVGMGLKDGDYDISVWKSWSMQSSKYQDGDCEEKWKSFQGSGTTMGTVFYLAHQGGWTRPKGTVFESPQKDRDSLRQFEKYLTTLHEDDEKVCIVREATYNDERQKWHPKNGGISICVKTLKEKLNFAQSLADVIGEYEQMAGCWIRINPMSEFGTSDEDVTAYKYALVESDDMPKEEQKHLMIEELKLPLVAVVDSGGKSVHGIVKVNAADAEEYKERVRYLYQICRNYGLTIDEANRNPSRMSRLPGAIRGNHTQSLLDVNVGSASWDEWIGYIKIRQTGLPQMNSLFDLVIKPPQIAEPLIDGILRKGRKMLISGASKTGKSFSLIGLAYALAFGRKWMGFQCTKTKVLYLNLEIADDSFNTRVLDVAKALGLTEEELRTNDNFRWLNMRGINKSLESLSASIIDMCKGEGFGAIILDPIYKVSFANENDAQEMAKFCNSIDAICQQLNCAMIYCHHHSKGSQSGKSAIDRMSGSGVLARDPDAIVDLLELEYTPDAKRWLQNKHIKAIIEFYLNTYAPGWSETLPEGADVDDIEFLEQCTTYRISKDLRKMMLADKLSAIEALDHITPIRFSASVREFPPMNPRNVYFMHPIHYADDEEVFIDAKPVDQTFSVKAEDKKRNQDKMKHLLLTKKVAIDGEGFALIEDLAKALDLSAKTIKRYAAQSSDVYEVVRGCNKDGKAKIRLKNTSY